MIPKLSRPGYCHRGEHLRRSFLLTSYFRKPAANIHDWTQLSRTSAFLVRSKCTSKRFHVISALHTTHPFMFPNLYPHDYDDWLKYINPSDCQYKLHIREEGTGKLVHEFPLRHRTWFKPNLDLVVCHLENEDEFMLTLPKFNIKPDPIDFCNSSLSNFTPVVAIGHDYLKQEDGTELFLPASLEGHLFTGTDSKIFMETPSPSEMGMCGAPVLMSSSDGYGNSSECIGVVEARVSVKDSLQNSEAIAKYSSLHGSTMLISASVVQDLIAMVDNSLDNDKSTQDTPPMELSDEDYYQDERKLSDLGFGDYSTSTNPNKAIFSDHDEF